MARKQTAHLDPVTLRWVADEHMKDAAKAQIEATAATASGQIVQAVDLDRDVAGHEKAAARLRQLATRIEKDRARI